MVSPKVTDLGNPSDITGRFGVMRTFEGSSDPIDTRVVENTRSETPRRRRDDAGRDRAGARRASGVRRTRRYEALVVPSSVGDVIVLTPAPRTAVTQDDDGIRPH